MAVFYNTENIKKIRTRTSTINSIMFYINRIKTATIQTQRLPTLKILIGTTVANANTSSPPSQSTTVPTISLKTQKETNGKK